MPLPAPRAERANEGSLGHLAKVKRDSQNGFDGGNARGLCSQVLRPIIWLGVLARGGPESMWTRHV